MDFTKPRAAWRYGLGALAALACAPASPAVAGPCVVCDAGFGPFNLGWWDDRPLSRSAALASQPRIDADAASGVTRLAAVWVEEGAAGDGDLYLGLSDDAGCSWSIAPISSGPADDRAPDVAVSAALGVVAVVFQRDGGIAASLSSDGGATFAPPELLAAASAVRPGPPRLAAIPIAGLLHLHAVWTQAGSVVYARHLDAAGPAAWVAAVRLAAFPEAGGWSGVDVAADTRSQDPASLSAVNIVAAGLPSGGGASAVVAVRSSDSGATFFGDATDPASRDAPRRVSDPPADASAVASAASIDGSDDGSGVFFAWNLVGWTALSDVDVSPSALADARAEEGASPSVISDWNEPPASADAVAAPEPARLAGLAVVPNPLGRPSVPDVHVFLEPAAVGTRDVAAVRGALDAGATPTVDLFCGPYGLTGAFPARAAGGVEPGSFAADEDLSHAFVVWADTRDGGTRIYFKRSDSQIGSPTGVAAEPAACAAGGGLGIAWTLPPDPPNCDLARIRVEYGLAPGSYVASLELAGDATSLAIPGLFDETRYYVRVTAIDEACNARSALEASAETLACGGLPPCPNRVGNTLHGLKAAADVRLAWEPPPVDLSHGPALAYDVYRSTTAPAAGYRLAASAPPSAWLDAGAVPPGSPSASHFYRVVARNSCGTSGDEPPP